MTTLTPLDPVPAVSCAQVDILAPDAGRTDAGLVGTVQICNGRVLVSRLLHHTDPADRRLLATEGAEASGVDVEVLLAGILDLGQATDVALRRSARGQSATGESSAPGDWQARLPVPDAQPPAPTLPARLLPMPLRSWLEDIATRASIPLEYVAIPALVGVSEVVGRTVGVRPERFNDWVVVPNLWGAIVGRPGWMKSAAVAEGLKPLTKLAATSRQRAKDMQAEHEGRRVRLGAELEGLKQAMAAAAKKHERGELDRLQEQWTTTKATLESLAVTERRYVTQDATVEKLGELLQENPRGLLVLRDELAGWLRTLEKQGREGDREFYLEAWNGSGGYTFDRIGRGTVHIDAVTLCVCGGIQPGKLQSIIDGALAGEEEADGLLQRFQLLVWPDRLGAFVKVESWPHKEARDQAYAVYDRLDNLDSLGLGPVLETSGDIPTLRFASDAQQLFDTWRGELEGRLRSDELRPFPAFEGHLSKYRSLMPSLALLFHLVDIAAGAPPAPISLEAAKLAAAWCAFLQDHARKVYSAELQPGVAAAHALGEKIRAGAVQDGQSVRDIYRHHWSGLTTPAQVDTALEVLVTAQWVRVETQSGGGRPTEVLRLHPALVMEVRDGR